MVVDSDTGLEEVLLSSSSGLEQDGRLVFFVEEGIEYHASKVGVVFW